MLPLEGFIIQNLTDWISALTSVLSDIENNKKTAIVIAISRKMPRMFEWLRLQDDKRLTDALSPKYKSMKEFVDSLNLTTEYALPFLFFGKDNSSYDVIVVDDIIIHGSTLRQVSSDICALTGKKPIASTIFKCENIGRFPYADTSLIDKTKPLSNTEAEEANRFIARAILTTSLPMDMVFPIFHVSNDFANEFSENLKKDKNITKRYYSVPHTEEGITSESILIKTNIEILHQNDFAKSRIFLNGTNNAKIVVYAPSIFRVDSLLNINPFEDDSFLKIWNIVKKRIPEINFEEVKSRMNDAIYSYAAESSLRERIILSLAAVANYLFSLSLMCYLLKSTNMLSKISPKEAIQKKDLQLILGLDLTKDIYDNITGAIESVMILSTVKEDLPVQPFLCPENNQKRYDDYRNIIAQKSNSIEEALNGVFDIHRSPEKIGLNISPNKSPETAGIAESFQSMTDLLANFKSTSIDIDEMVNKYIDHMIDEGSVSSFYAITHTPGKTSCIKRYFRAGSNSLI